MKSIYKIREAGREYCQTEGSQHYKSSNVIEPMDLIIAKGLAEDFCLANIIKYASRFKKTQNLEDLKKISDYSHILCGVKIVQKKAEYGWVDQLGVCATQRSQKRPLSDAEILLIHSSFDK